MMPLRAKVSDENAAGAEIIIVGYSKRDSNGGKNEYSQWQSGQSRDAGAADGADFPDGTDTAGLIPLGFCNVTLLVIPVAVGTLFMGLKYGVLLGLTFGATSFVSALLRPSTLVGTLMGASLPMVIVMTFLPRLMVPVVIHFVHKAMAHKLEKTGLAVAAACGSLTNTILYLGLMLIFYMICGIDNTAVLTAIGATAGGAGPLEAVAAALITPPIVLALRKAMHKKTA